MNDIFLVLLSLSVSGSILTLLLLALKPFIKNRFSQTWQYYIWMIIILRFLLPITPEVSLIGYVAQSVESSITFPASAAGQVGSKSEPGALTDDGNRLLTLQAGAEAVIPAKRDLGKDIQDNIWLVWAAGMLVMFFYKAISYNSFVRFVKIQAEKVTATVILDIYQHELELEKIKRKIPLLINNRIGSPMLAGMIRPALVIPNLDISPDNLRYIFRHELIHYRRKDILYKWLIQITKCLHWFNPLVYWISRQIDQSCEFSNDETIIRHLGKAGREGYGDALLASLKSQENYSTFVISMTMSDNKKRLKERLDAIMNFKKQSKMIKVLSFILTLMICLAGAFTGAYAAVPNQLQEKTSGQDANTETTKEIVFHLASNGQNSIIQSGSFEAEDHQILTITIQSDIKGGSVNLTFFSPDNQEQPMTFSGYGETRTIDLSAGRWAYNCTGFFKSGDITIIGTVPQNSVNTDSPDQTAAEIKEDNATVLNLGNGEQNSITQSGSFEAKNDQILTLSIQSDIKGGSVDLYLFSPNHEKQCITISSSDETKTIALSNGRWAYNCTGFFESGDITIVGKIE